LAKSVVAIAARWPPGRSSAHVPANPILATGLEMLLGSIVLAVAATLTGEVAAFRPADVTTDAVLATGYRSSSDNFRGIVNQMLIKDRKRFAQVERGIYQLNKK
jgi:hypothetical protein